MRITSVSITYLIIVFVFLTLASNAQIRIKAVGDIMLGSVTPRTILPKDEGIEFVSSISKYLTKADIVFGNLEGAIIKDGMLPVKCSEKSRNAGRCYEFGMPEVLSASLKGMGFNVLSMDNNHSEDYGADGYLFTQQKLNELGIKFAPKTGFAEFLFEEKKIVVAVFGYSRTSHSISDLENTKNVIAALDKHYDIIIVSFHGGAEGRDKVNIKNETEFFLGENRGNVIAFARTAIDAGADMVIGHGPHVLRAIEIYKNKLIAYSLGNFLTYGNMNIRGVTGISVILDTDIDFDTGDFLRGKLIPVQQTGYGLTQYDETGEGFKLVKSLTNEDFPENEIIFTKNGGIYNRQIILPNERPREEYVPSFRFIGK
ncbi:MAG: CapA family protein [Ignavibacteria bacterium]|nr:CapA family protein [Ignavibacteria bacterium]